MPEAGEGQDDSDCLAGFWPSDSLWFGEEPQTLWVMRSLVAVTLSISIRENVEEEGGEEGDGARGLTEEEENKE